LRIERNGEIYLTELHPHREALDARTRQVGDALVEKGWQSVDSIAHSSQRKRASSCDSPRVHFGRSALLAGLAPARRAASVEPMIAVRSE
jgi:hypothetical protein